jgi:hypothetical protein
MQAMTRLILGMLQARGEGDDLELYGKSEGIGSEGWFCHKARLSFIMGGLDGVVVFKHL